MPKTSVIDLPPFSVAAILSYNRAWMFILAEREIGKTYSVKMQIMTWLQERPEDKVCFITRFDKDKPFLTKLFDDLQNNVRAGKHPKIKEFDYEVKGGGFMEIMIDGESRGVIVAINEAERVKNLSSIAQHFYYFVFDEFIRMPGKPYAKNEIFNFFTIIGTLKRGKPKERMKDIKIFMMGNSISLFNPYFNELHLDPDPLREFTKFDEAVVQIVPSNKYLSRSSEDDDPITRFMNRSQSYNNVADKNAFLDNSSTLVKKKDKYFQHAFTFIHNNQEIHLWYADRFNECIFSNSKSKNEVPVFSLEIIFADEENGYKTWYDTGVLEMLTNCRNINAIFFESPKIKNQAIEVLKKLRIY